MTTNTKVVIAFIGGVIAGSYMMYNVCRIKNTKIAFDYDKKAEYKNQESHE